MANRRNSKVVSSSTRALVRAWHLRRALFLVFPYLLLFLWLFTGGIHMDVRPGELYEVPTEPAWEKPNAEHWFGTTGGGVDLFDLSRHAMATSVAVAVVSVALGIGLALLFTALYVFDPGGKRFHLLYMMSRAGYIVPSMVVLVILAGASGGSLGVAIFGLILVIAFHLSPVLASWFQEGESGFDVTAGYVLGLSRREIVLHRVFPKVLRRLPGVFASLVPPVVLTEMALSFLGLTGDRLSCGAMIAYGQAMVIEAPWMAISPGIMASGVVLILTFLGWRVSAALQSGSLPRIF